MKPSQLNRAPQNRKITDGKKPPSSGRTVEQKKGHKRCSICKCIEKESLKIKNGCGRFVDILDRGCSICFVIAVNVAVLLFIIGATYTLAALKTSDTLGQLFDAFGLGMLLRK